MVGHREGKEIVASAMQLLINVLYSASQIFLLAVGFALTYNVTRFFNFSHGVIFSLGAYSAYATLSLGLPAPILLVVGALSSLVLGCLLEAGIYRTQRKRGTGPLVMLLSSLGVYILAQNLLSMVFGDDTKSLRVEELRKGIVILGATITSIQAISIVCSIVVLLCVYLLLGRTKTGRAIRAVADDRSLADVSGIDSNKVIMISFAVGSAVAGMAGVLVAADVDMTPTMGMSALMPAVIAAIVGGMKRPAGILAASVILAAVQQYGAWKLGTRWQDVAAFLLLMAFLVVRPKGLVTEKT